jgi:hypothetical protein
MRRVYMRRRSSPGRCTRRCTKASKEITQRRINAISANDSEQQVQDYAMLQKHLSGPFSVNRGELLLGLDSVVVDAEQLALCGFAH